LFDVYLWFSATYLKATHPPTAEDIETVNSFLDRGMEHFPTNYRLPYEAGLNYIGYSKHRTREQRIRELTRGIEYLQRAARLEGAPDRLPLTVSWMYQRRRQLESGEPGTTMADAAVGRRQADFLAEMYFLLDDPSVRHAIERKLTPSPYGKKLLTRYGQRYKQRLERERMEAFPYLSLALWSQLLPPSSS